MTKFQFLQVDPGAIKENENETEGWIEKKDGLELGQSKVRLKNGTSRHHLR